MPDTSTTLLCQRLSTRLNNVLSTRGYPSLPLDRARALGVELGLDASSAAAFLHGHLMPDWDLLIKICALTKKEPGFFLDSVQKDIPTETIVVKAHEGGESVVVGLPNSDPGTMNTASRRWSYVQAADAMGFGIARGDYVVSYTEDESVPTEDFGLYVFGKDDTYELKQCSLKPNADAVFSSPGRVGTNNTRSIFKLPISKNRLSREAIAQVGFDHFGLVTAVVRDLRFLRTPILV